jgi:hypothetical protein
VANKLKHYKGGSGDDGFIRNAGSGCLLQLILNGGLLAIALLARLPRENPLKYVGWAFLILITLVWFINLVMTFRDNLKK